MPDTRYNTLEQIDNKFGETIKNGDTVPFLEMCVSDTADTPDNEIRNIEQLYLSLYI